MLGARANSTPQRSGARAVQQPQRDGMADSKFEVHAIVGERFYRFRHELRVEWAEGEEGGDRHTWELASTLRAEVPDLVAAYPSLMGTRILHYDGARTRGDDWKPGSVRSVVGDKIYVQADQPPPKRRKYSRPVKRDVIVTGHHIWERDITTGAPEAGDAVACYFRTRRGAGWEKGEVTRVLADEFFVKYGDEEWPKHVSISSGSWLRVEFLEALRGISAATTAPDEVLDEMV